MTTLLLGYDGPRFLLLTLAGERPLLLECPPELRRAAEPMLTSTMPAPPPLRKTRSRLDPNHVWQDEPPPPDGRARSPEVYIDPRTVFKRRGVATVAAGPRPRSEEPAEIKAAEVAIHDILIVPGNPGFRASEQGVKALVAYLRTAQILAAKVQRAVGEWTVIELLPDVFSHLVFTEGAAPPGAPSVLEGTLSFGPKPVALPFGDTARTSLFRLKLVGTRYARVCDAFMARMQQILYLRPEALVTAHEPARLRVGAARVATEPIPRFDMQEV